MEQEDQVLSRLLEEAKSRGLSEQDAITALVRVLIHNEGYRRGRRHRGKHTPYDQLLEETQPALALAWDLLRKHEKGGNQQ